MNHILRAQQFDRETLEQLFNRTNELKKLFQTRDGRRLLNQHYPGRLMFNVFYEPSTRTRMSFAAAAQHLGLEVVNTENARDFSSAIKGETLEDTIRVLCEYHPDVIVLRHNETGAAERASVVSSVPIINAGDGRGQHPTQALLDLYTVYGELGTIDGLTVVIGGDLINGRTARSLAYLLSKYKDITIIFVSPESLKIGEDLKEHLREKKVPFREESNFEAALKEADVVYWTRIQKERLAESVKYEDVMNQYAITPGHLTLLKEKSILMHPLPRVNEISPEVDADSRAVYFRQAGNGMFIRMALIENVLEQL